MDVCSAEAVLLERIFQQNEKAEFLEVKQTLLGKIAFHWCFLFCENEVDEVWY